MKKFVSLCFGFAAMTLSMVSLATAPGISVFGFDGERTIDQEKSDPLLLYVTIDNHNAAVVKQQNVRNKELREQFANTPEFNAMSSEAQAQVASDYSESPLPVIQLGSKKRSAEKQISFLLRTISGDETGVEFNSLAINKQQPRHISLNGENSLFYQFAMPTTELAKLTPGEYKLVAALEYVNKDKQKQWSFSKTISLSIGEAAINPQWVNSNKRAHLLAATHLADEQFDKAEDHCRSWTTAHPESVDAWASLGDALAGQQKLADAQIAYEKAMQAFRNKNGNAPQELPMELIDKMDRLEFFGANPIKSGSE